jgi:iron complex transport system ATP-binding protein
LNQPAPLATVAHPPENRAIEPVFSLREFTLTIDPARGFTKRSTPVLLGPINAQILPGITALIGPNGSGKSTLMRALAGLLPNTIQPRGQLDYEGRDLAELSRQARAQRITWLAQDTQMAHDQFQTTLLTVRGLIELAHLVHEGWSAQPGQDRASSRPRIDALMDHFDLAALQHRPISAISGGELQRAHLARVFAVNSPVMLLDEPSNHLDLKHQASLEASIIAHTLDQQRHVKKSSRRAVIYTTHDLNLALQADVLMLLAPGRPLIALNLGRVPQSELQTHLENTFDTAMRVFTDTDGRRRAYRLGSRPGSELL